MILRTLGGAHKAQRMARPPGARQGVAPTLTAAGPRALRAPAPPASAPGGGGIGFRHSLEENELRRLREEPGGPSAPELSHHRSHDTRVGASPCQQAAASTAEEDQVLGTPSRPGLAGPSRSQTRHLPNASSQGPAEACGIPSP